MSATLSAALRKNNIVSLKEGGGWNPKKTPKTLVQIWIQRSHAVFKILSFLCILFHSRLTDKNCWFHSRQKRNLYQMHTTTHCTLTSDGFCSKKNTVLLFLIALPGNIFVWFSFLCQQITSLNCHLENWSLPSRFLLCLTSLSQDIYAICMSWS